MSLTSFIAVSLMWAASSIARSLQQAPNWFLCFYPSSITVCYQHSNISDPFQTWDHVILPLRPCYGFSFYSQEKSVLTEALDPTWTDQPFISDFLYCYCSTSALLASLLFLRCVPYSPNLVSLHCFLCLKCSSFSHLLSLLFPSHLCENLIFSIYLVLVTQFNIQCPPLAHSSTFDALCPAIFSFL